MRRSHSAAANTSAGFSHAVPNRVPAHDDLGPPTLRPPTSGRPDEAAGARADLSHLLPPTLDCDESPAGPGVPVHRRLDQTSPPASAGSPTFPTAELPRLAGDNSRNLPVEERPRGWAAGETPAWLVSSLVHLAMLLVAGLLTTMPASEPTSVVTLTARPDSPMNDPLIAEDFTVDDLPTDDVGALSFAGTSVALAEAPQLSEISQVPTPPLPTDNLGIFEMRDTVALATGLHANTNFAVRGAAGVGTTGAAGAIDRLTQEIMMSLDERETLVVWLFDQSASLTRQRQTIHDRLERIYNQLGVIEQSGHKAFRNRGETPLLTSVIAFGRNITLLTEKPTADVAEIKAVVSSIARDDSGEEHAFRAIGMAAQQYHRLRLRPPGGAPKRNVMLIAFTDEAADDQHLLDNTVDICRRYEIPVYVVGVPAPFGRKEAIVKWVDPDPNYDQTPGWGAVDQGPESLYPERLRLGANPRGDDLELIDSGFGPYALTRLCFETGGIYFTVHPNRQTNRRVRRGEIEAFSAYLNYFFDPDVMRKYRPDYVSLQEYQRRVASSGARRALLEAAQQSWLAPLENPQTRFVKRSEAVLATALTEAQKQAAKLEPQVERLYQLLQQGEGDRQQEDNLRWQAGFDLAMGQILAMKVRTESYNAMLAMAKRGMKFTDEKNNTWQLQPADEISVGSQLEKLGQRAREYLTRVVTDHPDTPWALLAQRELDQPLGWHWRESFTNLDPPRTGAPGNNNNAPPPRDDQRRMLQRPKPSRPIPKL